MDINALRHDFAAKLRDYIALETAEKGLIDTQTKFRNDIADSIEKGTKWGADFKDCAPGRRTSAEIRKNYVLGASKAIVERANGDQSKGLTLITKSGLAEAGLAPAEGMEPMVISYFFGKEQKEKAAADPNYKPIPSQSALYWWEGQQAGFVKKAEVHDERSADQQPEPEAPRRAAGRR